MLDVVFMVLGGICTAIVLFGVVKMSRKIILTGLFYYSFLPIIGETMGWMADKSIAHLLFIALFLCQLILSTIKFETIQEDHHILSIFAVRVIGCFILINSVSAIIILGILNTIPAIFGIYHVIITVALVPPFIKRIIMARQ